MSLRTLVHLQNAGVLGGLLQCSAQESHNIAEKLFCKQPGVNIYSFGYEKEHFSLTETDSFAPVQPKCCKIQLSHLPKQSKQCKWTNASEDVELLAFCITMKHWK